MLKLLIADDEGYVREYMKSVLDWKSLGIELCEVACDSRQAIAIAGKERPDMALLDINMPDMDGLELTKTLQEMLPDLVFAFVTGYSEFEYARKALQLGAEEYVLKPFSEEELENAVLRLKLKITKRMQERHEFREDSRVLRENLLRQLILSSGTPSLEGVKERMRRTKVSFSFEDFLVGQLDIHFTSPEQEKDVQLWKFGICNILGEYPTEEKSYVQAIPGESGKILVLMNGTEDGLSETVLRRYFAGVQKAIWDYLHILVTAGIGSRRKGIEKIYESYRESEVAVQEQYTEGAGKLYFYSLVKNRNKKAGFYRLDMNDHILEALRKKDKKLLSQELCKLEEEIRVQHYAYEYSYMIYSGILSLGLSFLSDMNADITEVLGGDFSPYKVLRKQSPVEEFGRNIQNILEKIIDAFWQSRSKRVDEIIQSVEQYIRENYQDYNLSVEKIAEGVHLDASYIRRIFSKYMSCTIVDYLTEFRMKKAKELLESNRYSIAQVAEQVGYLEPGYFSKCFKKYYGMTPSACPVFYK